MALQPWQQGIIIKIANETHSTKRFWIQLPALKVFDFKPGQFVTLDLPIHEKPNKRWRSYSIASWPDGSNTFELVIVLMEDGLGTPWLWANAQVGTTLILRGPQGVFTLPATLPQQLFLICTGTGIAPFRSMVHHVLNHQINHGQIHLIFGCRRITDGLYLNELKSLEKQTPSFHFTPTFSKEEKQEQITTGYVHQVYESIVKSTLTQHQADGSISLMPASFYLCGWKMMIDEARQRIQQLGYDKTDVHFELYG